MNSTIFGRDVIEQIIVAFRFQFMFIHQKISRGEEQASRHRLQLLK